MTIFTLEKIFKAYKQCQKGKKNTVNALNFELDREKNLINLLDDLKSRKYQISRHICFIVTNPSPREIFAADFRDRIVHHFLCNEIQEIFEIDFIPHSYANRKNKGTHKAVQQVKKDTQNVRKTTNNNIYYLKLDIQSFFRSIDKGILYSLVEKRLGEFFQKKEEIEGQTYLIHWKEEVLWLAQKIIFHDPTGDYFYKGSIEKKALIPKHKSLFYSEGKGLPIGNLTSQFFANVYLNEMDQFINKGLGVERYIRYVDDFVMIDEDKNKLKSLVFPIGIFLEEKLNLRLHPNKIQLQEIKKGIDFLGYFIKPSHTLVRQKVVKRFKKRLYKNENEILESYLPIEKDSNSNVLKVIKSKIELMTPVINSAVSTI